MQNIIQRPQPLHFSLINSNSFIPLDFFNLKAPVGHIPEHRLQGEQLSFIETLFSVSFKKLDCCEEEI